MQANAGILHFPRAEDAEVVERRQQPSGFQDPRLWVTVVGVVMSTLLTIVLTLLNAIWGQMHVISGNLQALTVSATQSSTQHGAEIHQLQEEVRQEIAERKKAQDDQTQYNFNLKADLVAVKTKLGMKDRP